MIQDRVKFLENTIFSHMILIEFNNSDQSKIMQTYRFNNLIETLIIKFDYNHLRGKM